MKTGIEKQSQNSRGGGVGEGGGGQREENRGNGEKRMKKGETGWKIVWVCDLCLGSSVSPGEAAY